LSSREPNIGAPCAAGANQLLDSEAHCLRLSPPVLASGAILLLALTVMTGWQIRAAVIVQILPHFAPMQFNTALEFFLCGSGLLARSMGQQRVATSLACVAILIALATFIQYLAGLDFGIDTLFAEPFVMDKTSNPGRMAPNTAICFMLSGFGLLLPSLLSTAVGRYISTVGGELPALIVAAIAAVAILGYIGGNELGYGWSHYTQMAMHTAGGFFVFGAGLAAQVWREEGASKQGPLWVAVALYVFVIYLELYLPGGIASGVAYLLPVLSSYWFPRPATPYVFATLSTVIILLGTYASPAVTVIAGTVILNRALSIAALWATAYLVARQRRAQLARQALVDQLKKVNTELEQFAYVASHDLKAPLRGIDSLATWIADDLAGTLEGEPKHNLDLLRSRVKRMEELLDAVLAYSRAGRVVGDPEMVDAATLVRETFEFLEPPAGFSLEIEGPMPRFRTAPKALEQVFQNLFSNAIKHHDRSEGTIRVSAREHDGWYAFAVADDGPGIPPRFHERIFEMFQSLRPHDEVEGAGMGLAVVKKSIESVGGTIRVETDPTRRGTTFRFSWPKYWSTAGQNDGQRDDK